VLEQQPKLVGAVFGFRIAVVREADAVGAFRDVATNGLVETLPAGKENLVLGEPHPQPTGDEMLDERAHHMDVLTSIAHEEIVLVLS
jgi:hypothetical protein